MYIAGWLSSSGHIQTTIYLNGYCVVLQVHPIPHVHSIMLIVLNIDLAKVGVA